LRARRLARLASGASPGQPRLQGPMIGRDAELGVLLSLFDEVVGRGQPRLLNMVGSAGVGKSRLVAEAVAAMTARRPDLLVLRGRCPSAGRGITYWALGEILREACSVSLTDPLATFQDKCSTGLREILGRSGSSGDLDATVFALAATCGVNLPGARSTASSRRRWPPSWKAPGPGSPPPARPTARRCWWSRTSTGRARSCWRPSSSRWPARLGPCSSWPRPGRSWPRPIPASAARQVRPSPRSRSGRWPTATAASCWPA
jgi:hypothetical protein